MERPGNQSESHVATLHAQIAYARQTQHLMNQIHAAKDLDDIFVTLQHDMLSLFDAEHLTLYAVDYDRRELYSKFLDLDEVKEIRVPIDERSLAGFVARNKKVVNIADAYNTAELRRLSPTLSFDSSWDTKTGVRTKQVLTVPTCNNGSIVTGVMQLINKKGAARFTPEDEDKVRDIAQTLGIALANQYQLARRKQTKFDSLLAAHLITPQELDTATAIARTTQCTIESILMGKYKISKKDVGHSLSTFYSCPFFDPTDQLSADPELVRNINLNYLRANYWVPLGVSEERVDVLIDDPHDFHKLQDIRRLFPSRETRCWVGLRSDILHIVNAVGSEHGLQGRKDSITAILGQLSAETPRKSVDETPDRVIDENDSAIVRLVNQMILDAYKRGASDIHIEPYGEHHETLIRFRVDGVCHQYHKVPPIYRRALSSRLKVMARLDIAERRKPQDGKIKFRTPEREIELRVATVPTAGTDNEDVTLRLLAASEPIPLDRLQMAERNLRAFTALLDKPYGILLCVGPTGSGKTTTLHSALGAINTLERKIWTAEDPVEITQYGLRQVQVHPRIGYDFATAMRAFLRADPDVIMVGEIRDRETAEISIQASLTGHLVLSTLHTNSAVETVTRLLEMRMDPFNFADALLGVLAQRLARTICAGCKERYHPSREEYDLLACGYGEAAFAVLDIPYTGHFRLARGRGCEACHQTGYRGRIGLHELLIATDEIKRLIHERTTVAELFKVAVAQGMTTLVQDGIMKCIQGWTDYKQVQAVAMR